jgi:hypothetical protein
MRRRPYRIRWLGAADAERISAVERAIHPPEHRAGAELIWAQLAEKDEHGGNISLGLFLGRHLVGYLLVFVMCSRREIADFFDAPLAEGLDPGESSIYASDFGVLPAHRNAAGLLAQKFAEVVSSRSDLRGLSLDAFGTDSYADMWTGRKALIRRLGWELVQKHAFQDPKLQSRLHWLQFERVRRPRDRDSAAASAARPRRRTATRVVGVESLRDWRHLRHSWNELLLSSSDANVLQSYEYLSCWYKHVGITDPLRIRVQMRGETPEAIALLRRIEHSAMGLHRVLLANLKDGAGGVCSPLITDASRTVSVQTLVEDLLSDGGDWDSLRLSGLSSSDLELWRPVIENHGGFWVASEPSPGWSRIDVSGTSLPITEEGGCTLHLGLAADVPTHLERLVLLERVDEDAIAATAISASSARLSLHRELAQRHAAALGMNCAFLEREGMTLAGLLGYDWQGRFLVTHLVLPEGGDRERLLAQMLGGLQAALVARGTCGTLLFDPAAAGCFGPGNPVKRHLLSLRRRTATGTVLHAAAGLRQVLNSMDPRR